MPTTLEQKIAHWPEKHLEPMQKTGRPVHSWRAAGSR